MSGTLSVSMDTSKSAVEPTLEEEAAKLDAALESGELGAKDDGRPEWLDPKFKTLEDQAKAYSELQKKLGEKSAPEAKEGEGEPAEEGKADEGQPNQAEVVKAATEVVAKAGLDLNTLNTKYAEQGAIDDSDYAALEKTGIPRSMVDQFIAGQEAIRSAQVNTVFSAVGGEENYGAMIGWAGENLPPKEIAAFNKAVNGTDMDAIMLAVKGLKAQYEAKAGFEPSSPVKGQTSVKSSSGASYRSLAEMQEDMANPRYQRDPAFRAEVEQKLARSDIF